MTQSLQLTHGLLEITRKA